MKVLVTGAKGQLGAAFLESFGPLATVVGVDRPERDITDPVDTRQLVRDVAPNLIVNCAAYNDVDGAETAPLDALRNNAEAVWTLAGLARELDAVLVHYSTDFVFDGTRHEPYREEDDPNPRSVYGMSKLLGERCAAGAPRHFVLRLSSLFGGHTRRTFVDRIISLAESGQRVQAFADRTVSPSYVPDVVDVTRALVDARAPYGLYHCGSNGDTTWSELASHVLARLKRPALLETVPFAHRGGAERPQRCALADAKLASCGIHLRHWKDAVDDYLSRLGH